MSSESSHKHQTYLDIVYGQFLKNRMAVLGSYCIYFLIALAVFAPLIAGDAPIVMSDHRGMSFPMFERLFNRLFFENSVDIFFNLIFVLSPIYLIAYLVVRKKAQWGRLKTLLWGLVMHVLIFAAVAPKTWFFVIDNPLYVSKKIENFQHLSKESVALMPPCPYNYRQTSPLDSIKAPSDDHWFGTDREGRDVFARMLFGTRVSLTIGIIAVMIYIVIGTVLGALAGYFGGRTDMLISRLIEIMICIPSFMLILTIAAMIEDRSIFHVMFIIGITSWTGVARLVRAEFLKQREQEYYQAAVALGHSSKHIIFNQILPNAMAPILISATFGIAEAILIESGLSFLGLGDVNVPSWGDILNTGRLEMKHWLILIPGFAIFFVVSVFNLVGEGLRDSLDPKLRR